MSIPSGTYISNPKYVTVVTPFTTEYEYLMARVWLTESGGIGGGRADQPVWFGHAGVVGGGHLNIPRNLNNNGLLVGGGIGGSIVLDTMLIINNFSSNGGAVGGIHEGHRPIRAEYVAIGQRWFLSTPVTNFFTRTENTAHFTRSEVV